MPEGDPARAGQCPLLCLRHLFPEQRGNQSWVRPTLEHGSLRFSVSQMLTVIQRSRKKHFCIKGGQGRGDYGVALDELPVESREAEKRPEVLRRLGSGPR